MNSAANIFVRKLLILFIPAAVIIMAAAYFSYRSDVIQVYSQLALNEDPVHAGKGAIGRGLDLIARDALYLSRSLALQDLLEHGSAGQFARLANEWLEFSRTKQVYDQIRWIDESGMERIRVNFNNGNPLSVQQEFLQDKHDRYYFRQAMQYNKNEIYISPFDLNVEAGQIEQPRKPIIRIATPLIDKQHGRRGILILNYLGDDLIERFKSFTDPYTWLTNATGYWLRGPDRQDEWGFMYNRPESSFAHRYPQAWRQISTTDSGSIETGAGHWSYLTVHPLRQIGQASAGALSVSPSALAMSSGDTYVWKLMHFTPRKVYAEQLQQITPRTIIYALLAIVVIFFAVWRISRSHVKEIQALAEAQIARAEADAYLEQSPDPMIAADAQGRLIKVNQSAADFFGYSRDELLGMQVEQLMPERYREVHIQQRAGFSAKPYHRNMSRGQIQKALLASGELRDVAINLNYFTQTQGRQVYTAAIRDVTRESLDRQALHESRQRLLLATESAEIGVWEYRAEDEFLIWDERMYQIYGVCVDDFTSAYAAWKHGVHAEDWQGSLKRLQKALREGHSLDHEFRIVWPDGSMHWIQAHAIVVRDEDGIARRMIGVNWDITEDKEIHAALRNSEQQFQHLLDSSPAAVRIARDHGRRVVYANPAYRELINAGEDARGKNPVDYYANPADYEDVVNQLEQGHEISNKLIELKIPGDGTKWTLSSYLPIQYEGETAVLAWFSDITALKLQQQQLENMAHYDSLTNLPNRLLLADRLQHAMAQAHRRGQKLAVVYIDLDGFKAINDTHGHDIGDQLLITVSKRMKKVLRESDTLARIGGDEFIAVLDDLSDEQSGVPLLKRLLRAACRAVRVRGHSLQVTASMGVTFYPQSSDIEADQLIRQADQAMYRAKLTGKNRYYLFTADMNTDPADGS